MAASRNLTPEQRIERARGAYLAGAVNTVARRVRELTPDQRERIAAAITNPK